MHEQHQFKADPTDLSNNTTASASPLPINFSSWLCLFLFLVQLKFFGRDPSAVRPLRTKFWTCCVVWKTFFTKFSEQQPENLWCLEVALNGSVLKGNKTFCILRFNIPAHPFRLQIVMNFVNVRRLRGLNFHLESRIQFWSSPPDVRCSRASLRHAQRTNRAPLQNFRFQCGRIWQIKFHGIMQEIWIHTSRSTLTTNGKSCHPNLLHLTEILWFPHVEIFRHVKTSSSFACFGSILQIHPYFFENVWYSWVPPRRRQSATEDFCMSCVTHSSHTHTHTHTYTCDSVWVCDCVCVCMCACVLLSMIVCVCAVKFDFFFLRHEQSTMAIGLGTQCHNSCI